ncbi:hypothetical protein D3Z50_00745 [Clostridiaceae bacterium]|nr:hypothetical protein [Clostridiaceae bacterium]
MSLVGQKIKQAVKAALKPSSRKIALLCLYGYIASVFLGQYITGVSLDWRTWIVPVLLAGAVIAAAVTDKLCQAAFRTETGNAQAKNGQAVCFAVCFLCTFGVLMAYYYAFFPGSFSPDSNGQLAQAISGNYSDWHPFIHTLLFFTIPMKIWGAEEMIVFLQLLYFSAGLAYLLMTVRTYGCPWHVCALGLFLVLLSPVTGNILMYPWKDCGLAIFSMAATAHYIHIILSRGEWLRKKRNAVVCSLFLALTALVRHNAILFVLPMAAALMAAGWKRYKMRVCSVIAMSAVILLLMKIPLYHAFKVEKPGGRILESTGMCMVVMGNVVKNCPEALEDEVREFLYKVSPKEVWEEVYGTGNFNSVKWRPETDVAVIEQAGAIKLLKYTFQAFRASEMYSLQAFLQLTGMVWKLDGDLSWNIGAYADTEKTGITLDAAKQEKAGLLVKNWKTLMDKSVLRYPMYYIGWFNLALIALALTGIRGKRDWIRIVHALPLLCYNFGTALLLTGFDWRFFYLNFPLIVPTAFLLARHTQEVAE